MRNASRCQRALEEVYWRHRTRPADNPRPKPPLDAVLPSDQIEAKVLDGLRKARALEVFWKRPITNAQLQAEIERMARDSPDPARLRELWAALDNDPGRVAECLARPVLADRLVRHWYAYDESFHGSLRRRIEQELQALAPGAPPEALSGQAREMQLLRGEATASELPTGGARGATSVVIPEEAWSAELRRLAALWGENGAAAAPPLRRWSPLQEEAQRSYVVTVLETGRDGLRLALVEWPKRPFETWWAEVASRLEASLPQTDGGETLGGELPELQESACTEDSWQSLRAVPDARDNHVAVWTGSEMILSWSALAGAVSYDVVQGDLGTLRATGGDFTAATESCLAADTTATQHLSSGVPAPGEETWFLVRGGGCGGDGTYDTGEPSLLGSRDAEVDAAASSCP